MFTAACPEYLNLQIFGYDLGQAVVGIAEYIYGCSIVQIAQAQAAYHLLFCFFVALKFVSFTAAVNK